MVKVEMYVRPGCPYCYRAKALLDSKGVEYIEYDIIEEPEKGREMTERSGGGNTTPQIFIDGKPVGGCDDIHELEAEGKLDGLLGLKRE